MKRPVSFRGRSGKVHVFSQVMPAGDWLGKPGLAIFAAPEGYAWRVIRMCELRGTSHDIQPLWAQADAARYGGDTVLVLETACVDERKAILADLEAGLSPLWPAGDMPMAA